MAIKIEREREREREIWMMTVSMQQPECDVAYSEDALTSLRVLL